MKMLGWVGLFGLLGVVCGCSTSCPDVLDLGKAPELALVDDQGAPASARGEVRFNPTQGFASGTRHFDCTSGANTPLGDLQCVNGVLTGLEPYYAPNVTMDIAFELADGSLTEPMRVKVDLEKRVVYDGRGETCPQTVYDATAEPVIVPAEARLDKG